MFKNFCQNAFISLYFIVSTLGGFSAKLEFRSFSPYQSIKVALGLGLILILLQFPILVDKSLEILRKKVKHNEWHRTNEISFLYRYDIDGMLGFCF